MSKTGLHNAAAPNARALPAVAQRYRLSPLEATERGFALFRFTFANEAWRYYAGTVPLVLCFIPMWVVDGQIKVSNEILLFEAVVLAAAYVWRAIMVTRYMQRVRTLAFGTPAPKSASAIEFAAGIGALVGRKIVLSVCALASIPSLIGTSWFYNACQFASIEAREEEGAQGGSMGDCLSLASQWLGAGLLFFFMLFPLWATVWLNGVIVAIAVPILLHSIFGLNTILSTSMGIYALSRSSAFWLLAFAGAWMALDPIVKCSFVIVYQHLRSRREGYDLRDALASLPRQKKSVASATTASMRKVQAVALIMVLTLLIGAKPVLALPAAQDSTVATADITEDSGRDSRVQKLRKALDEESQRAIYRWHDAEQSSPPNWFDKLMAKMGQRLDRVWNAIVKFLAKLWPKGLSGFGGNGAPGKWSRKDLALWITVIAVVTIGAIVALIWLRRRRDPASLSIPASIAPLPDLSDAVLATARSEDEWFALASQLEREGDLRLALRAAYLGLLAGLAQREWLTIRRDRTNRDYLDEFTRRWRRRPQATVEARAEIPCKLRSSMQQFDRVWYGFQVPTTDALAAYRRDQKELLSHV